MDEKALFERLDKIIQLLDNGLKAPSLAAKIANGIVTGVGIFSILSLVEIIRYWFGG